MDDETTEERDDAERDDLTPDEAHRVGEFDDLRDMLARVLDKIDAMGERIDGIYDNFTDSVAQMIENGATVKETDDAAEAIAEPRRTTWKTSITRSNTIGGYYGSG